jgi:S1-C subfamily serine protease
MDGIVDKVVIAMSSAFTPFPTAEIASEIRGSTPRKRKVEYASGIVVSPLGHILTDRRSVEECDFIVVPGGGNADRVAVDATSDVALLRIYGGDNLTPIAMASDSAGDSDVVLVGIADPQAQDGGNAVSTVHARLVAASARGRAIEPTPSMGFSGAAAVNGEGHFAGVVEIRPQVIAGPATSGAGTQAIVIPVEALHDFFAAQKLLPTGGHAGAQDPTRSIVRVICVRK